MHINTILMNSNVDGPGNRIAIFLQGCNFNCSYCHNPETLSLCKNCGHCVSQCNYKALTLLDGTIHFSAALCQGCDECETHCPHNSTPKSFELTPQELYNTIKKYLPFAQGVTLSGGEACLQSRDIEHFFSLLKELHPKKTRFIDTNGSILLEPLETLCTLTDKFIIDLKAIDEHEHTHLTGSSNKNVIQNILFTKKLNKIYEIRTVLTPLINFENTAHFVATLLCGSNIPYQLIPVQKHGNFKTHIEPVETDSIEKVLVQTQRIHPLTYKRNLT